MDGLRRSPVGHENTRQAVLRRAHIRHAVSLVATARRSLGRNPGPPYEAQGRVIRALGVQGGMRGLGEEMLRGPRSHPYAPVTGGSRGYDEEEHVQRPADVEDCPGPPADTRTPRRALGEDPALKLI